MIGRAAMAKEALSHALSSRWLSGSVSVGRVGRRPGRSPGLSRASGLVLERLEFGLVDGFLVGLGAIDDTRVEQRLDGAVHGAHAEAATGLHGVLELVELALADEIGRRRGIDQDLE